MPIKLITVKVADLIGEFNSLTLSLLLNHMVSRVITNSLIFAELSPEDRHKVLILLEKIKAYVWSMEKFGNNLELVSTPSVRVLGITVIHDSPVNDEELMIAQFDLSEEGLRDIQRSNLLTFVNIVLNVGIEAIRDLADEPHRLISGLAACKNKFDQVTAELAQLMSASTRWYQVPLPISQYTSVILRLLIE